MLKKRNDKEGLITSIMSQIMLYISLPRIVLFVIDLFISAYISYDDLVSLAFIGLFEEINSHI